MRKAQENARLREAELRAEAADAEARAALAEKSKLERELANAREIQMSMVPTRSPEKHEFSIFGALQPARQVGGDFYDFFFFDKKRICLLVGDVSDKGMPAALFMARTTTLLRANADTMITLSDLFGRVNTELSRENAASMFVTLFAAILDLESGLVTYSNAGHNPPYVCRAGGKIERMAARHGPALGALEGVEYGQGSLTLSPGDMLVVYTDDISEAMDKGGELFTEQRYASILKSLSPRTPRGVVNLSMSTVQEFEAETQQSDDITVLAIHFFGVRGDRVAHGE